MTPASIADEMRAHGYMIVRALLWLVRGFSMLPPRYSRRFAKALNAGTRPFHVINYLGSRGGARVLGHGGMESVMDRVTNSLTGSLDHADEKQLARGMHFPVGWDPYFRDYVSPTRALVLALPDERGSGGQRTSTPCAAPASTDEPWTVAAVRATVERGPAWR